MVISRGERDRERERERERGLDTPMGSIVSGHSPTAVYTTQ